MLDLCVREFSFEDQPVTTMLVEGRDAWIARQIGARLGYANDGKRFANKITGEWAEDFITGKDYAVIDGAVLEEAKACIAEIAPGTKALLVLFESGVHMALVKTQMPAGRKLRRFLVDEVLPALARTGEYTRDEPEAVPEIQLRLLREARMAARVVLDDRRFRVDELRYTASLLHESGHMSTAGWAACNALACEIALGEPLGLLHRATGKDWVSAQVLADRFGVVTEAVLDVAAVLGLTDRPEDAVPFPLRGTTGWTVSFRFSPKAATLIEAWLDESLDPAPAPRAS